jgi:glyoxylase-like metal-dependent hydrolase (beta-lactamase superfamily II)
MGEAPAFIIYRREQTMTIGPYEVLCVETGRFGLDGGAMFGVVPRTLWERTNPPDERNRITMAARALLLRGNGRTILVDTGNGTKYSDKARSIYKFDNSTYTLAGSLREHGVAPESVTDVILTHLHFDHAGGGTVMAGGKVEPTFPNARYYVQRAHWDAAHHATERDKASFLPDDYLPLMEHGLLEFVDGEREILPGIKVMLFYGHTTALQCPLISDGRTSLLYCADLMPTASHVQLPWIMGYDLRPLVTLEEKRHILRRATEEQWILVFEHDPAIAAARVIHNEKGYAAGERIDL